MLIDSPALPVKKLIRGSINLICNQSCALQVVNIGNSKPEKFTKYIEIIEKTLDKKADRNLMPMEIGDIQKTWADTTYLKFNRLYPKDRNWRGGIEMAEWYCNYYSIKK